MNPRKDRGIVLVAVLFAVAIMSVLAVAASALTRSGITAHGLEQRRLATHLALRSGLESAKALIASTPPGQRAFFDGTPVVMDLGGGLAAEVTIRDAAGLADLNRTELPVIEALLSASLDAAEAADLAARMSQWRSKAAELAQAQLREAPPQPGAGAGNPQEARQERPPAPVIFQSVDQLKAMAKPGSAASIMTRFTVFNPTGLLNPLAASDDVLLAIPGFTPGDLAAVKAARKGRAARPEQGLQAMLERLKPFIAVQPPSVFLVGIRLADAPGVIGQGTAGAAVQLVEKGPLPFRTLAVSGL
jgi:type II secretory pathway component PulK